MASADEKLERLEEMVETLKRNQQSINVTVTAPTTRKLKTFEGRSCDLHDWMEDARNCLSSISSVERLHFLIAHLDGPAREEVRYAPEEEKDSVDKLFALLVSTFGETRSNAQLKKELYDRGQGNRESVRDFSRALLEISEGLSDKSQSKNETLIEVFCENLVDPQIKREMKKSVRNQPTISFSALRSEAIRLEEDGLSSMCKNACIRGIHEPHHTSVDPSILERIATQLELLATTQTQIVSLLRAQQSSVGVERGDRTSRPKPRNSGSVSCEYCGRSGHTYTNCWKRAGDMRRTTDQTENRAYGGQPNSSATPRNHQEN